MRNGQKPPCCHSAHKWRHEWQHGSFCPFLRSFGCVLLLNQIFRKQCTVRQYTTLIYLINLLGILVLGLGLDSTSCTILAFLRRIRKMSTLSSANVTVVNLVLKERTHKIKIKYSMHQYSNFHVYFRQLANALAPLLCLLYYVVFLSEWNILFYIYIHVFVA